MYMYSKLFLQNYEDSIESKDKIAKIENSGAKLRKTGEM